MRKIIYTRPDGGLSVVTPIINSGESITEEQALERAIKRLPADAIAPQIVDEAILPADRTYRNAWRAVAGAVDHDMAKCRDLHRAQLRRLRAPKFAELDAQFMQALERGIPTAAIAAKRQALRDVTDDPRIASATTPDDLKAVGLPDVG